MKFDPMLCKATGCQRQVGKLGDLVCPAHWRRVPRDLRQLMIREQTARDVPQKRERVIAAAGLVIAFLETLVIQLPAETP